MTDAKQYWRRDQLSGITPPDLNKHVEFAEHIVKARGKRTQFTSVSTSDSRIDLFGPQLYALLQTKLAEDGHLLVQHEALLRALQEASKTGEKAARQKAVQATRYARKNYEGLVDWRFDLKGVEAKSLFVWTADKVRPYFVRR
ncbi:hypothetical protein ACNOYE_15600 [Nannocystaceae bacterium ST9]